MKLKFTAGLFLLFIVLIAQFWLATAGIYLDLAFAALISFAFIFGFWELMVFVVLTTFIINWQPAASLEILIFALFPVAVYFSRNIVHWQLWLEDLAAIFLGYFVLYLSVTHGRLHWTPFFIDTGAGLVLGALIFFVLS
jgi:hypothetical protein